MDERSAANKLSDVFSDMRINPIYLAMLTRRLFHRGSDRMAADWWMYHNMDIESRIRGDNKTEIIDMSEFDNK